MKNSANFNDFAAFIKKLKLDKPLLCGWSDGGQIELDMGLHYPDLAKAMVLGGTMIHCTQEMIDGFKAAGIEGPGQVDFEKLETTFDWFIKILKEETKTHGKDYWKTLLLTITKMWFDPSEFPEEKVKDIQTPSLILLGDRDEFIPISEAIEMHKLMPNTELAIIPNGTHTMYLEQQEIFDQIDVKNGDIVIYFDEKTPKHAGKYVDRKVISKWGIKSHAWRHGLFELPIKYGDRVKYYAKVSREDCLTAYKQWVVSNIIKKD